MPGVAAYLRGPSRLSLAEGQDRLESLLRGGSADPDTLGDELFAVTGLLGGSPGLRRALTDPNRPDDAKAELVARLLRGQVSAQAVDLLSAQVKLHWTEPGDLVESVDDLAVTALLHSAEQAGRLDAVEDELFRFSRTVAGDVALRDAFSARSMGADRKAQLVRALLQGKVTPQTLRLATQAAVAPRGLRTEQVLEKYLDAAADRRSQLVAEVVSAVPLSDGQRARLSTALRRIYGRDIRVNLDVDPQVIGGLRVQVGGELIDSTMLTKLHNARRALAG
jgi:F-type H+-transporting ATPase subunit delta